MRATARERGSDRLVVGSFTVAAAQEIAGRGLPIDKRQVGTLHALAYRSIDHPPVAVERLSEWNLAYPALRMSDGYKPGDDGTGDVMSGAACEGDALMQQADTLRARMVPAAHWPARVRRFSELWNEWKSNEGVVDFTDMIELAMEKDHAPGNPLVGFFDEFQDFTPLEIALVRHWAKSMDRLVVAGDDDQCLYSFKGASADAFLDPPVSQDNKRLLSQSYRVPYSVHAAAQAWVERLSRREPKDYTPRDAHGVVRNSSLRWKYPEDLVHDLQRQLEMGRTAMILATCGYMLDPVKHRLKEVGIPFHNPYRPRGDWNPLSPGRGVASAERLLAYLVIDERVFGELSRLWTGQDVKRWTAVIKKKGVFRRGAGGMIGGLPDRELSYEEVEQLFDDPAICARAVEPDLEWFSRNLLSGSKVAMEYPIKIARNRPMDLIDTPRVVIGSIHSVKGGEADSVYLFPDLSMSGVQEYERGGIGKDSVIRQMYVGMTRAREELVVCEPSSQFTIDPSELTRGARLG